MNTYCFDAENNRLRWHDIFTGGTPLIFLHGLGCASSSDYLSVVTAQQYCGTRSWLVDFPGAGFSDKPVADIYHSSAQARIFQSWITSTAVPCVNLFGHSAGAFIAIKLAELMPEKVSTLILCEPGLSEYGVSFLEQITATSQDEFIATRFHQLLEKLKAEGNEAWLGPFQTYSAQAVYQWALSALSDHRTDWLTRLAALPLEKKAVVLSDTASQAIIDSYRLAGCQVVLVPDSGHMMAYDNPNGLASALYLLVG